MNRFFVANKRENIASDIVGRGRCRRGLSLLLNFSVLLLISNTSLSTFFFIVNRVRMVYNQMMHKSVKRDSTRVPAAASTHD